MQLGTDEWKTLLARGAARMGVTIDARQAEQMAAHALALVEWNRKINLTAITDPMHIAVKHYLDALWPLPFIPSGEPLLDLGTGAGFPGIPLKIMRPLQAITLIDASRKKINFIKHVIRTLKLTHISAVQARAEAIGNHPSYRGRFDGIVCRAFADIDRIAMLAAPFLTAHGKVYVYQGPGTELRSSADKAGSSAHFRILETHTVSLPVIGDRRILTIIRPVTSRD